MQGWIDVTYLSADGSFRLSRGNKGTLFILSRDVPASSRLIVAIRDGQDQQVRPTHTRTFWPEAGAPLEGVCEAQTAINL